MFNNKKNIITLGTIITKKIDKIIAKVSLGSQAYNRILFSYLLGYSTSIRAASKGEDGVITC